MEYFKTLEDLRDYVKTLLGKFYARPTEKGAHPTLYIGATDKGIIQGVRKRDYLFSFAVGRNHYDYLQISGRETHSPALR